MRLYNLQGRKIEMQMIALGKIILNDSGKYADRDSSDQSIEDLMNSILDVGLQSPIGVIPDENGDKYELVYGRNRLTAFQRLHKRAGGNGKDSDFSNIPAVIVDPEKAMIIQLDENLARSDLSEQERTLWTAKRAELVSDRKTKEKLVDDPQKLEDEAQEIADEASTLERSGQKDEANSKRVKASRKRGKARKIRSQGRLSDEEQRRVLIQGIMESDKVSEKTAHLTLKHILALGGTQGSDPSSRFKAGSQRLERLIKSKNPLATRKQREALSRLEPEAQEIIVNAALDGVQFGDSKKGVTPILIGIDKEGLGKQALKGQRPVKRVPPEKRKGRQRQKLTITTTSALEWSDLIFDLFGVEETKRLIELLQIAIEEIEENQEDAA